MKKRNVIFQENLFFNILTLTLFLSLPVRLKSQNHEKSFALITDQDYFYIKPAENEDRNYTQGTSFSLSNDGFYNTWAFLPFKLINGLFDNGKNAIRIPIMSTVSLLGTAFTPRIIDSINPIIGDRPFAFLLAISTSQVNQLGSKSGHGSSYESFTINYGILGTNVGYEFQSFAHKNIVKGRPTDPRGWNTQISKGGKLTILFNYEKLKCYSTIKKITQPSALGIDGFANFGGSVGYYDRLYTGMYARFGWIDPLNLPAWAFWGNGLSTASRNTANGTQSLTKKHFEGFIFSRATVNIVARNSLLVGQRFNSSAEYTLDPSWIIYDVLDFDFGLALGYHWMKDADGNAKSRYIRCMYKNTMRSPEFNSKIFPERWHYFGSIGLQFSI